MQMDRTSFRPFKFDTIVTRMPMHARLIRF
jgi:hypothetical protein